MSGWGNGQGKRRYTCTSCWHTTKLLDRGEPDSIRTGCQDCQRLTRWVAINSPTHHTIAANRRPNA